MTNRRYSANSDSACIDDDGCCYSDDELVAHRTTVYQVAEVEALNWKHWPMTLPSSRVARVAATMHRQRSPTDDVDSRRLPLAYATVIVVTDATPATDDDDDCW